MGPKIEMLDLFSMRGDPLPAPTQSQAPASSVAETQSSGTQIGQSAATQVIPGDTDSEVNSTMQKLSYSTQAQTQYGSQRASTTQTLGKRSPEPDEEDPDLMNKLFPGAAAMKKRRIQEEEVESARRASHPEEATLMESTPAVESSQAEGETPTKSGTRSQAKGKRVKTENPILIAAREVKEEEEKKKQEAESDKEDLDEEAIRGMKNLGVVQFMEIKPRTLVARVNAYGEEGERWDPRWNGRPSFKKFRCKNALDGGMTSVRGNVIIPLVEHKSMEIHSTLLSNDSLAGLFLGNSLC